MKKYLIMILTVLMIIVLVLIVLSDNDNSSGNTAPKAPTLESQEPLEEDTTLDIIVETDKPTEPTVVPTEESTYEFILPSVRDYLDGADHRVVNENYWTSMLGNEFEVPMLTNKNLRPVITGLLMGYSDCIFATNDFNERYKGYFDSPISVEVINIDFNKECLTVRTKMKDNMTVTYTVYYTIKDSLIDSLRLVS